MTPPRPAPPQAQLSENRRMPRGRGGARTRQDGGPPALREAPQSHGQPRRQGRCGGGLGPQGLTRVTGPPRHFRGPGVAATTSPFLKKRTLSPIDARISADPP